MFCLKTSDLLGKTIGFTPKPKFQYSNAFYSFGFPSSVHEHYVQAYHRHAQVVEESVYACCGAPIVETKGCTLFIHRCICCDPRG